MRIFAAGISTESNSFSVMRTGLEDFEIVRGRDVATGRVSNPSLNLFELWGKKAVALGHEFIFSLNAWANPSGVTVRTAYEAMREEILTDLAATAPVDVVLLMLHGAMLADGYDDCEADLIGHVRRVAGPATVIAAEFDLHANVSEATIADADIVVAYKEYPHIDINDRAADLFELAVAASDGRIRPTMALVDCRMAGQFPTSRQPLRAFVDAMSEVEREESILSVSLIHGFRCGDVPHMGAKMLVVTDNAPQKAKAVATEFAHRLHAIRHEIGFASMSIPFEQALSDALGAKHGRPIVVADQADNPGSGSPGDATFALRWLVDRAADRVALAFLYDPEVVRIARKAGVGARLDVRLGGKLGPTSGTPVDIGVTVRAVATDYVHSFPQQSGSEILYAAGDVVALRCGGIDILVNSVPIQCYSPSAFADLGVDLAAKHLVVVKSAQHFHGAFAPLAAQIVYMTAPGAAPPDPRLIPYRRFDGARYYPWVDDPFDDTKDA